MIILDSDVMIDILREYQPALSWLASSGDEEILLPGFVVMELIQGCQNKSEPFMDIPGFMKRPLLAKT